MRFELWRHEQDDAGIFKRIAVRDAPEVRAEYHTMQIGEERVLREDNHSTVTIIRSK